MPYFDEYGPGFDQTGPNAARSFDRYSAGDLGPTAGPLPGQQGFFSPYFGGMPASGPGSVQRADLAPPQDYGGMPADVLADIMAGNVGNGGQRPRQRVGDITRRSSRPASRHDDPDLLTRIWRYLFGGPQQQAATQQAMGPITKTGSTMLEGNPFEAPPTPSPTAYKPATKISSSPAIRDRIQGMIGMPTPGPDVTSADYSPFISGGYGGPEPTSGSVSPDPYGGGYGGPEPAPGSMPQRIDLRGSSSGSSYNPFNWFRAEGGPVPGYMRGGYPELYDRPVRRTFDSGGENFVGSQYGNDGGRTDKVNARLSPKEYVMDAESMALLGDGNPDHGAKKMDHMRVQLRKEKGKALAKGKISPDAKPAMSYVAGNPMGDGLRRRGREKK